MGWWKWSFVHHIIIILSRRLKKKTCHCKKLSRQSNMIICLCLVIIFIHSQTILRMSKFLREHVSYQRGTFVIILLAKILLYLCILCTFLCVDHRTHSSYPPTSIHSHASLTNLFLFDEIDQLLNQMLTRQQVHNEYPRLNLSPSLHRANDFTSNCEPN